jgi:hypothetical protein
MYDREWTLASLLADPMTLTLMAADKVALAELTATWAAAARAAEARPAPARTRCVHLSCGRPPW